MVKRTTNSNYSILIISSSILDISISVFSMTSTTSNISISIIGIV